MRAPLARRLPARSVAGAKKDDVEDDAEEEELEPPDEVFDNLHFWRDDEDPDPDYSHPSARCRRAALAPPPHGLALALTGHL